MNSPLEKLAKNATDPKTNNSAFGAKDDSFTKAEDEFSLSDGGDSFLNKSLGLTHFNFQNVRFTPKVIEFVDAFEGKQFSVKITIQNVGRNPVWVKIGEPSSFIFQLRKPSRHAKFLAAGASISKTVSYTFHNVDLIQKSQIPIQINGHFVDYPIVVKKAVPDIEVQPQKLDFEIINLGASAKTMVLTISNKGGKRTKFKVDIGKNVLDLVVSPMRGTIRAKSQVNVLVEMMGLSEGEYYHELWIKTNELPIRIPVLVKVVRPQLEIVFPNGTEDFTLITFKPTFNGTQRAQAFVLKNCSTDTTLFNTLAEVNGELEILANARSTTDVFNMFLMTAEEGRLEPFENRICTVLFRPKPVATKKSWHHKEDDKKGSQWEHIIFLRINRVQRIERRELVKIESGMVQHKSKMKSSLSSIAHTKINRMFEFAPEREEESVDRRSNFFTDRVLPEEKVLRLCLHGNAISPDFLIQPFSFEFGDVNLGETVNKVLRVTNNTIIPVMCKLRKAVNVKVSPVEVWLKSEKAHEFVVSLSPRSAGRFKTKMKVEIYARSDVVFDSDKSLEVVAVHTVVLNYNAKNVFTVPAPKIGLGITPLLTDDVGLQKDLVTFKDADKIPFAAVLKLKHGFKTPWMHKETDKLNNVSNAIVALPNDRPRLYYTWPKDKICRAIFTGLFRYSPPEDLTYTLSSQKRKDRKQQDGFWADFLKELRKLRYPNPEELEYELSCESHYNMKRMKPSAEAESVPRDPQWLKGCVKEPKNTPEFTFVPLSPMLLSNVTVEPKFINFNKVAVNTMAQKEVLIRNMNSFSISIKFVSGKSAVSVMETDTITIEPSAVRHIQILFQTKDLGRYFGFLNYVINGSHEFKITISAFVTSKTLTLGDTPVNIQFGTYDSKEAFQPRSVFLPIKNLLQSPIKYRWNTSPDSAFFINITEGEIPPRSTLLAEVLFDVCPRKSFYSEMTLLSESGNVEAVKLVHLSKKVAVNFLSNRVDMHDIPLNLPTKVKAVIQNACYHEVAFEVIDANPVPGITIEPKEGLIKARSFLPLEIKVQIPVIMKFSFDAVLMVHFVNKISVKVTGNVVAPVIRMKPSEIVMRKISAHSVDTFAICVENIGTTPAEVLVDFKNCPEYKLADNNQKLYLVPKQSSKFLIQFEPTDVSRYMFYLPVTVNGILGPPEMQEPETENVHFYIGKYESVYEQHGEVFDSGNSGLKVPCVCLNSTVTPSLLSISPPSLNFFAGSKFNTKFQPQNIVFTNDSNDDITFCLRTDDLGETNDSPFNLLPVTTTDAIENRLKSIKVQLSQGERLEMTATFDPKRPGSYSAEVPIFVRGYSNGLVYNLISLKGELKPPRIYPEVTEIHFPPLPLDVGCDVIVVVCAEDYRTSDTINCILYDPREDNGDSTNHYMKTNWLIEPNILPCRKASSFQLQINFRSCIPIALRKYILLFDSMGTFGSILVTAVADNSVLTAHAFLSTRSTKYRLIRDKPPQEWKTQDIPGYPIYKSELKLLEKTMKEKKQGSKMAVGFPGDNAEANAATNAIGPSQVDKGPKLIVQETKSMSRSTQLGFVSIPKHFVDCEANSSTFLTPTKTRMINSFISKAESTSGSKTHLNASAMKRTEMANDVSYPYFPVQESLYRKHFEETLYYVERWMFEVVMRCDQHFSIPSSFQRLIEQYKPRKSGKKSKTPVVRVEKDFLDFLREVVGPDENLPKWSFSGEDKSPESRVIKMHSVYADILRFLESKGCLLPHVRPEFLMAYEDYVLCSNELKGTENFSWKSTELEKNSLKFLQDVAVKNKAEKEAVTAVAHRSSSIFSPRDSWKKSLFEGYLQASEIDFEKMDERNAEQTEGAGLRQKTEPRRDLLSGRHFVRREEILDQQSFELRSTQAWLDVVIQILRVLTMSNIVPKNTIPQVSMIGMNDRIPVQTIDLSHFAKRNSAAQAVCFEDSHASNVYTLQERILMDWLNCHCQIQQRLLWGDKYKIESLPCKKIVNNFDKDLADSVALIAVTASHCPYIVSQYFNDVFYKPDTPNESYHNAAKLIQVWRVLEIGLTVETSDIVQPNPVFMVMLVTRLYEVLPLLHPHSLVCFSTPLTTGLDHLMVIQLKNESQGRVVYKAKFFGEDAGFFHLGSSSLIELKPLQTTEVHLTFTARKIKRTSATLIFSGCCVSPNFGKHLAFYLEGEPSQLPELENYSFSTPLYKVICTALPIKPPFPEPATYEIWYTTKQPEYSESVDISVFVKPWAKIRSRKVSRRLFLSHSEVTIDDENPVASLPVAVACLTDQIRLFWLLFRSKICDFIISVAVKPKMMEPQPPITGYYSDGWSPSATCLCSNGKHLPKPNSNGPSSCPFLTEVKIPVRNDVLWNALWTMFQKTLQPHERSFWKEHFEMDIGICLILWLLSPEEEEEVVDEFIHVLPTRVSYSLKVEPPNDAYVIIPASVEISDVRKNSEISLPVHISKSAPSTLLFKLTMTSENGKEIRCPTIRLAPRPDLHQPEESP